MTKPNPKIRVAVLYGGRSAEHEVSLQSAANVIKYLDRSLFEVVPIGIDKQGSWLLGDAIFNRSLENKKIIDDPNNNKWFAPEWLSNPDKAIEKKYNYEIKTNQSFFDVIFPAVHGSFCEDGTLQGLLEVANMPYVGSSVLASAIGMDKDVSKRLAAHAGITVPPYLVIKRAQWNRDSETCLKQIKQAISFPLFVKPANTGSSIGIHKVKSPESLLTAIHDAFRFDSKILIEKAVNAVELELAVLESLQEGEDPIVSVVGEIKSHHEFYSYEAKYIDENGAELCVPAAIDESIKEKAADMAKAIFNALECEGMARVDLFLDRDTNELFFNEINTLPGFTEISMYPKLMGASGITYPDLLTHLVKLALIRHENKNKLERTFDMK